MIGKPEKDELEEAKKQARKGVESAKDVLPKEEEVKIGFGWTENRFHKEKKNGVSGMAFSPTYFEIDFNSGVEGWEKSIVSSAVHEFAHTYFYERKDMNARDDMPMWMYILSEALTQNTAAKIVPEVSPPWRTKHSKEVISEYWSRIKEKELDRPQDNPDPLFIDKSDGGYPHWLGYSMSYLIGKQLIEEGYELEEFPELVREDVVKAGNKLFGNSN